MGDDAVGDLLEHAGAGGADAFNRLGVAGFDGFGKQLGKDSGRMDKKRERARKGAEPDGDDEQHRPDDLVDRAQRVHQPPHRLMDPPGGDIRGGQKTARDGADDRQHRAPDGDLDRDQHLLEVEEPIMEVGRIEVRGEDDDVAPIADQLAGLHLRAVPRPGEDQCHDHIGSKPRQRTLEITPRQGERRCR